jgi:hypothetical protein
MILGETQALLNDRLAIKGTIKPIKRQLYFNAMKIKWQIDRSQLVPRTKGKRSKSNLVKRESALNPSHLI